MDETVVDMRDFEASSPSSGDCALSSFLLGTGLLQNFDINVLLEPTSGEESVASASSRPATTLSELRRTGALARVNEDRQATLLGGTLYMYDVNGAVVRQVRTPPTWPAGEEGLRPIVAPGQTMSSTSSSVLGLPPQNLSELRLALEQLMHDSSSIGMEVSTVAASDARAVVPEHSIERGPAQEHRFHDMAISPAARPESRTMLEGSIGPPPGTRTMRLLEGNLSSVDEAVLSTSISGLDRSSDIDDAVQSDVSMLVRERERPHSEGSLLPLGLRRYPGQTLASTVYSEGSSAMSSANSFTVGSMTMHSHTMLRRLAAIDSSELDNSLARSVRRVLEMGIALTDGRLSEEDIKALPKICFEADEQSCAICLDDFKPGELLTELPCAHYFHVNCVARWFQCSEQCPLCRAHVVMP